MKPSFFILLLTLFLNSCSYIHLLGTKKPEDESKEQVNTYLKKHRFTFADHSVLVNDSLRDSLFTPLHGLDTWKLERKLPQSAMHIRIYDSEGKFVNGYAQCYGPYRHLPILKTKDFQFFKQFPNNTKLKFSDEPTLWNISASQKEQINHAVSKNNYTIVVYWTIWSNHFSKVMLKAVKSYVKRYESADFQVQVILVNNAMNSRSKNNS